jgi:hypothetical protein
MLTPDLALADVDSLILSKMPLVLRIHEASNEAFRPVAASDHRGDHAKRFMDGRAVMLARIVHRREIAAGDERDLVTIAIVIFGEKMARFLVFLTRVMKRQPADRPGHFALRTAACKGIAS